MQHLEALVGSGLRTGYAVRSGATGAGYTGVRGVPKSGTPWATKKPARGGLGVVAAAWNRPVDESEEVEVVADRPEGLRELR